MIVYHGSYTKIEQPDLLHTRENIDFGPGFYLTENQLMATTWAANNAVSVINKFERSVAMTALLEMMEADRNISSNNVTKLQSDYQEAENDDFEKES